MRESSSRIACITCIECDLLVVSVVFLMTDTDYIPSSSIVFGKSYIPDIF